MHFKEWKRKEFYIGAMACNKVIEKCVSVSQDVRHIWLTKV